MRVATVARGSCRVCGDDGASSMSRGGRVASLATDPVGAMFSEYRVDLLNPPFPDFVIQRSATRSLVIALIVDTLNPVSALSLFLPGNTGAFFFEL